MAKKTIANLNIHLSAGTAGLQTDFNRATGLANKYGTDIRSVAGRVTGAVTGMIGKLAALAGAGSAIGSVGWGLKLAADAEQSQVAFTTILKSADAAAKVMGDLRDFAAATPFEFPELRDAARSLLAFGVTADQLVPTMRMVGDVSSGIGAPIGEIAEIFGKAKVSGRLFMEDINQLTGRGIPIIQELARQFGVAESEVRNLVSNGSVNFGHLEAAFASMTGAGGQFADMMAAQSATLAGRWSTLKDSVSNLALQIGNTLLPVASRLVETMISVTTWLGNLDATVVTNTAKLVAFAAGFGAVLILIPRIVAGVRTIIATLQALAAAQAVTAALAGPAGWAKLAVAAGVAAGGVALVSAAFEGVNKAADKATASAGRAASDIGKPFVETIGQIDDVTGAIDEAANKLDAMKKRAEQIALEMRTPIERFQDDMRELRELKFENLVSSETFDRAASKYREELEKALGIQEQITKLQQQEPAVAAVRAGSGAAFSAIQQSARDFRDQVKLQQLQLSQQRNANEILSRIDRNTRAQLTVQQVKI